MSNTNTEVLTTAYENLQGALTQANTVLPPLQEAIKKGNLDNYATNSSLEDKANKVDLDTANARIDAFTSLSEGSTTGDAELIDGRSVNGKTYTNIGGAIRALSSGEGLADNAITGEKLSAEVISAQHLNKSIFYNNIISLKNVSIPTSAYIYAIAQINLEKLSLINTAFDIQLSFSAETDSDNVLLITNEFFINNDESPTSFENGDVLSDLLTTSFTNKQLTGTVSQQITTQ